MTYWLMKTEPNTFSIDDLQKMPNKTEHWDGIRNYQVRNMIRDQMQIGDEALFYHSNCKPPGIAGLVKIISTPYPDHTAFDPQSKYFDPKSQQDNPRWFMVDVQLKHKFSHYLSLDELRQIPELENMLILRRGNRLSITEVTPKEWQTITKLGQ